MNRLTRVDWDFTSAPSASSFSSIHWYPCRYASQIPATLIGLLSDEGEIVLDPFVGSGTTLVEAQRLGRPSVGVDISPIACLVTRSKVLTASQRTLRVVLRELYEEAAGGLLPFGESELASDPARDIPPMVQGAKWYTRKTLRDLSLLWSRLRSYRGVRKTLAEAIFSAILLPVCRETRHWGYVCDNSQPKGDAERGVLMAYRGVLQKYRAAYDRRQAEWDATGRDSSTFPEATVAEADGAAYMRGMAAGSVGAIVTSPPYFGVTDYSKSQRLSMEWFSEDIEARRRQEVGARSKRHRGTAWVEYIDDMKRSVEAMAHVLKPGGYLAMIIGESGARRSCVDAIRTLISEAPFDLVLERSRNVSVQRRQAPSIRRESLVVARRSGSDVS